MTSGSFLVSHIFFILLRNEYFKCLKCHCETRFSLFTFFVSVVVVSRLIAVLTRLLRGVFEKVAYRCRG